MDKQIKIIDSRFNVIKLNESWPDNTTMNADGTLKIGNLIQNE